MFVSGYMLEIINVKIILYTVYIPYTVNIQYTRRDAFSGRKDISNICRFDILKYRALKFITLTTLCSTLSESILLRIWKFKPKMWFKQALGNNIWSYNFIQSSRCILVEGIIFEVMSHLEKKRKKVDNWARSLISVFF